MSRIFDALQRSGTEHSGIEYPDTVSVATKVFEALATEQTLENYDDGTNISLERFPAVEIAVEASSKLVFLTGPTSLAAEKFRFLGVRMRHLQQARPLRKVLVTSTIAEEGKSLVSANLAGVLARRKRQKVLLVEGDIRRPVMARQFGLGDLRGLAEWLRSDEELVSNIYHLKEPDFWLMPAGAPPANALELLQSGRLTALLSPVTSLFDWIIVDSPPLLPLGDTSVWQRVTDATLLVVREGVTEKSSLRRGLELLRTSSLLGVVLNSSSNGSSHNYYQRYASTDQQKDA